MLSALWKLCCCSHRVWEFCVWPLFSFVLGALSSSATILLRKRAGCFILIVLWLPVLCVPSSWCRWWPVSSLWLWLSWPYLHVERSDLLAIQVALSLYKYAKLNFVYITYKATYVVCDHLLFKWLHLAKCLPTSICVYIKIRMWLLHLF